MKRAYRNKAVMLFALTLLVTSLILASVNLPTVALPTDDLLYLHGPSLTPIHMHGPPLVPVHMHAPEIIDLTNPWVYPWHEIYPDFCQPWTFTSWEDNGNGILDSSDQIDMTNDDTAETRWYHVDRVTMTMGVWSDDYQEFMYVEFKGDYTPQIQPICTLWHEVYPVYHGVTGLPYHVIDWMDTGIDNPGYLGFCDYVMFESWPGYWWHVEEYATDLILNEKIMNPIDIMWHELYPSYCNWHVLTSWEEPIEDPYPGRLSPGDQIDMYNETSGIRKWYFVDRVTLTLNVTIIGNPEDFYLFEYKGSFETMYNVKTNPVCTDWHMVWPEYWDGCFHLEDWTDNCNGVLDYCDEILLEGEWCHVEGLAIDIILNEKIEDPTGIIWHELYPDCCINDYETLGWEDNGDGLLNPCDNVTLALLPTGSTEKYHVENMTLTLNLTVEDVAGTPPFEVGERIYIEYLDAIYFGWEWLYYAKTHANYTDWEVVCPNDLFSYPLTIENWWDNCNGVLSYCDNLELLCPDGALWVHVDEVALDITVKKIVEEPPPPPWYKKSPYPDYAPSGMPDFDQKQDAWYPMFPAPQPGHWTWCGPVAVANSLWWFDSKYDPSNIVPAFPGVPDDHHVKNVAPLVANLSWWMDTDGQRTGTVHTGTFWMDMVWGIDQYLRQQGVNDTLEVHSMEFPHFGWIEEEIYICQDVVLLLEFWWENPTGGWERIVWPYDLPGGDGGHYVTCAGVNSTTFELLICDPWWDAAEAGWPGDIPVPHAPHAGDTTVHNDTQYVSHDAYLVVQWDPPPSPYPGSRVWELVGYLQQWAGFPLTYHTFITVAVATSPRGVNDVAVINVTTSKDGCNPMPNVGQGEDVEVNATVENQGDFAETFNVTAYADTDVIGEQQVTLNPGENKTLTFTWDTTGFPYGNYTISAVADTVPGETQTGDNTDTADEDIKVGIAGDVNADGKVNILDAIKLAGAFGSVPGDSKWNPNADINGDGRVNILDAIKLAGNFGKSEP